MAEIIIRKLPIFADGMFYDVRLEIEKYLTCQNCKKIRLTRQFPGGMFCNKCYAAFMGNVYDYAKVFKGVSLEKRMFESMISDLRINNFPMRFDNFTFKKAFEETLKMHTIDSVAVSWSRIENGRLIQGQSLNICIHKK